MSYLVFIHWYRWYVLTSYAIDITGPMMVLTQKVTTMAFSLHDGKVKKLDELTPIQKREALRYSTFYNDEKYTFEYIFYF